ncbi:hypothetical protein ACM66B_003658 [Microbotryomycetes sp. NB124-2]
MACPLRCPTLHVSIKNDDTKRRKSHPGYIKLYFEKDVHSDPMHSSQMPDLLQRAGRPSRSDGSNEQARAADDDSEVSEQQQDVPATPRRGEPEIQRLRRELREAQIAAREARMWRIRAEDLENQLTKAEEEVRELEASAEDLEWSLEPVGRPDPDMIADLREEMGQVQAEVGALEETVQELQDALKGAEMEKTELENSLHEAKLKADEKINRLEARLKDAGEDGERRRKELELELDKIKDELMRARASNDKVELNAKTAVVKARDRAKEQVDKAQEQMAAAAAARKSAEEEVHKSRDEMARIKSAIASWTLKYDKLRAKYDKLKLRKQAVSDDESEMEDEDVARPAKKRARVVESPGSRQDDGLPALESSPERQPFKVRNVGAAHGAGAPLSTKSSSTVIDLISDDDDDLGVPVVKTASASSLRRPTPSLGLRAMDEDLDILPTLSVSTGGGGSWVNRNKDALAAQPSDLHLPNFATGLSLPGPRGKSKIYRKR